MTLPTDLLTTGFEHLHAAIGQLRDGFCGLEPKTTEMSQEKDRIADMIEELEKVYAENVDIYYELLG